ncbi:MULTISPECIES: DUF4153 domain-containing protein [Rhizobium]|uniref:Uncharacterized protein n=1 Tax=Rhizobium miluonense TaxID=411945 RepID=A0A1C3US09_9HYPH|nr:DUF4173 domain-containing protein [Rhizobium miluonense]SCB18290.1 protein of unknown function [Rhizobium miluonense]
MSLSNATVLSTKPISSSNRKLLILIVLVALADILLFNRYPGLNLFLFANIAAAGLLICSRRRQSALETSALLAFNFVASAPLVETASRMGITISLLGLSCVSLGASGLLPRQWIRLPLTLLRFLLEVPLRPFRQTSYRWLQRLQKPSSEGVRHHLRGWIMPLSFAAGFLALFAMANPLIDRTLRSIDLTFLLQLLSMWRIGFWLAAAVFLSLLLHPRLKRRRPHRQKIAEVALGVEDGLFGHAALLRSLAVFNALFAVQTLLDLTYLWGGASLPNGMSHAEYAHRGAYPLLVTALLAAIFVLVAMRHGGPGDKSALLRGLVHLWIAQNILLCLSSILRLDLYVEVYSLTELRVAAGIWMGLVAIGLFLILLRILLRRSNEWLIALCSATLVLTLYAAALVDIPAFIARFNVNHSREISGEGIALDIDYLLTLGPAAIPALDAYMAALPAEAKEQIALASAARGALTWGEWQEPRDWRSWTYRAARLGRYLQEHPTLAR